MFISIIAFSQVSYEFRTDEFPQRQFPSSPQLGFIAQEVQAAAPQLVTVDSEGYLGVAYSHVTVLLTEAVKELQSQHDAEVAALRAEVRELRQMVELLLQAKA